MKILVACEESQAVTIELRKLGHEAYSNDILECSGGYPEWHLQQSTLDIINDGWDMIIAFPPCTYLTNTANAWLRHPEDAASKNKGVTKPLSDCRPHPKHPNRRELRDDAMRFFLSIAQAECSKICLENPIGYMNSNRWMIDNFTKPKAMHPYQFGDPTRKATMFWVKGLPALRETYNVKEKVKLITYTNDKGRVRTYSESFLKDVKRSKAGESSVARSKTFPGIAKAMAEQWAGNILNNGE